jgi:hypothetical protein
MTLEIRDLGANTLEAYLCCGRQPDPEMLAGELLKRR